MKKLPLLLLGLVFISHSALAGTAPYTDGFISEAVYQTKQWGIFSGYSDGSFQYTKEMNRAELSKVLVLSQIEESEVASCAEGTDWDFVDVADDEWYSDYVYCAKAKGWVSGDDGLNTFRPGDPVLMGETFKMIVESQYGTPSDDFSGTAWYDLYRNFLDDYQIITLYTGYFSDTVYHQFTYLDLGYEDQYIGFDSDSLASKMGRGEIAELLYRMRIVFSEQDGSPYDLLYSFDEMEELYGTEIELKDDLLSIADPHTGFRAEAIPVEKIGVDADDWRVYVGNPSALNNGGHTTWWLYYSNSETGYYEPEYNWFFYITAYDSSYYTSQYDFEDDSGRKYLWWCPPGYGTTVAEILASKCVVDEDQNVDADYVNFSA
jgi:hypothetical protein